MPDGFSNEPLAENVPEGWPGEAMPTHQDLGEIEDIGPTFDLSIFIEPHGILCQFKCEGRSQEWTVPKTVVRRVEKAMPIDHVFDLLGAGPIIGYQLREAVTNDPEFLMVPRGQRPDRSRHQGPATGAEGTDGGDRRAIAERSNAIA